MFCLQLSMLLTIHVVCDLQLCLWVITDVSKRQQTLAERLEVSIRNDLKLQQ